MVDWELKGGDFSSICDFWADIAQQIDWIEPWLKVQEGDFRQADVRWFVKGKLNVSANCLDRHLPERANDTALIWVADDEGVEKKFSFAELHSEVCKMANVLLKLGVQKGARVAIYLPMIPEAIISMLACTRIGAIHTVVFAGFSAHALGQRIRAADCTLLITADGYQRGGKKYLLKQQADEALEDLSIKTLVVAHANNPINMQSGRDFSWTELRKEAADICPPVAMDAEDPLFILYTSGSTGLPKGLVHTTGGYLVQVSYSHRQIFNCSTGEVFWCTADVGWITGHSYVVYAPLANGITTLVHEGVPNWPDPARCWRIIDKYRVSVFYTAPTAIRSLKSAGDKWLEQSSRASLRLLGTVGEPINPEVWQWYARKVGASRCPVVDTWWQTETGAIMLSPQPPFTRSKPGAACQPLPGIIPVILDAENNELQGAAEGALAIKYPWPAMARTIYLDHNRYQQTYFANGYYRTGDGAKRDEDGDYWLCGRIDDVLNVAGHRLGTAEIESVLMMHPALAEAAVVGFPHEIKGEGIAVYLCLKSGFSADQRFENEITALVTKELSAIARPDKFFWIPELPKTRSGKIMRRILRQIAAGRAKTKNDFGDLSTLTNPDVIAALLAMVRV